MIRSIYPILLLAFFSHFGASAQTVLKPGDLAIVGLASNVGGNLGNCTPDGGGQFLGRDRVSFVCFRDIEPGTVIDITDNGWERVNAGQWGNTEGFVRAVRSGATIPAGTVITFELPPTQTDYVAVAPDGDWDFLVLGTNTLNFNDSGDQLYFMQGGVWDNGTTMGCCNGDQDARYTGGVILFGFNSRSAWNAFIDDSQSSGLHPDVVSCFNMAPTSGVTNFTSYSGPVSPASQLEWIGRISDPDNWTAFPDCMSYQDPPANIAIAPSGMSIGCTTCRSCVPVLETLVFSLPATGGPFTVEYTDGLDTFLLSGISAGEQVEVDVAETTAYDLVSVTDMNGCPIYSNFGSGTTVEIRSTGLEVNCVATAPAPGGSATVELIGGVPPFTITWQNEAGESGQVSDYDGAVFSLADLQSGGSYTINAEDAYGCATACDLIIETAACAIEIELEVVESPDCDHPANHIFIYSADGGQGPYQIALGGSGTLLPIPNFPYVIPAVAPGSYSIVLEDAVGCRTETIVAVPEAEGLLQLDMGPDVSILEGQSAYLVGTVNFLPSTIIWEPEDQVEDPNALVTVVFPKATTTYTVTAIDGRGCAVSDDITVNVVRQQKVFIPNAFSPNNDGVNDVFTVYPGPNISEIRSLLVFDRWGSVVFDGRSQPLDENRGWNGLLPNGQEAAAGVYLYWLIAVDEDQVEDLLSGSIALLR